MVSAGRVPLSLVVREQCVFAGRGNVKFPGLRSFGSGCPGLRPERSKPCRDQNAQKRCQPCDKQSQVMPGSNQNGVDGISASACEVIALEQTIGFGMADNRFDGVSSPELTLDCR